MLISDRTKNFFLCKNHDDGQYLGVNLDAIALFYFSPEDSLIKLILLDGSRVGVQGEDATRLLRTMGLNHPARNLELN